MNFISGFLGLCSAVSTGSATEIVAPGYGRQAIQFANAANGVSVNRNGYDFGSVGVTSCVGRAIYDAPTGGNLILVLPHATPRPYQGGSIDRGEVGQITLLITALGGYPDSSAYSGSFAAGATVGLVYDRDEMVGWSTTAPNAVSGITVLPRGGQFLAVQASVLSAGAALTVNRGLLAG